MRVRSSDALSGLRQAFSIGFVSGKAFKIVNALGQCLGTLVRCVVSDQIGSGARNCLAPIAGILPDFGSLRGINVIADDACQHSVTFLFAVPPVANCAAITVW